MTEETERDLGRECAQRILTALEKWAEANDCEVTLADYGKRHDNPMGARFTVFAEPAKKGKSRDMLYSKAFTGTHLANRKSREMAQGIKAHLDDLLIRR